MEDKKILVTGGCGFIGRWVVKMLLAEGIRVVILDDLGTGSMENIEEFSDRPGLSVVRGATQDESTVARLFREHDFDACIHLAAKTQRGEGLDTPKAVFESDVRGTFILLEACRSHGTRFVFVSSAHVYQPSVDWAGISESFPTRPASPFLACKIAGENLALSFWHAYDLPVTVLRPFDTYGPFQRADTEGGIVAEYFQRRFEGRPIEVYDDGMATRDLMEVTDCARFVVQAGLSEETVGEILNGGSGRDVTLNCLADWVAKGKVPVHHVPHPAPRRAIQKFLCNYRKARDLAGWRPRIKIEAGLRSLEAWMEKREEDTR